MRYRIGRWLFFVAMIALLVLAGILLASGADWTSWMLWVLAWPALLVVCAFIVRKPRRDDLDATGNLTVNLTVNNPIEPEFGEMKGDNA